MNYAEFNELAFFAKVKKHPGMFFGRKSFIGLRDHLFGMNYAFSTCGHSDALKLLQGFIEHYNNKLFAADQNGYVCWWNHILYTSGAMDDQAFDTFYCEFEAYLLEEHNKRLPEVN